jgi:hypothetical protein
MRLLGGRVSGREAGAAAIIVVLLMSVVLIGLASVVVELGLARDTRRQAQNAADSAALAGANVIASGGAITAAVSAAKNLALRNFGTSAANWSSCTDSGKLAFTLSGDTPCISFNSGSSPSQVRVLVPFRPVVTPLGGVFGNQAVNVQAVAVAGLQITSGVPCGVCVIGSGTHNIQNGQIVAQNANVDINGQVTANPQAEITVTGGVTNLEGTTPGQGTYSPAPNQNQSPVADPLATLALPSLGGLTLSTNQNSCTNGPGVYKSLTMNCTMQPGLYVITGDSTFNGNDFLNAPEVTLYFTCAVANGPNKGNPRACNANENGAGLKTVGNGTLSIQAPTTGPTAGLALISDRNSTSTLSYRGNGTTANTGTVYAKSGTLDYRGNGTGIYDDSMIVVNDITFSGSNGLLQVTYTTNNNAPFPTQTTMSLTQ